MKSLKSLVGMVLGGVGALTSISVLMNACTEDQEDKPLVEVTTDEVEACCGADKNSPDYMYCINRYIYTGNCITNTHLENCCGTRASNDDYSSCVRDYLQAGYCANRDDVPAPLYGMIDDPDEFEEDDSTFDSDDDPIEAVYGPPEWWDD